MTAPWGAPSALAASAPVIELIPEVQGVAPSGQGAGFGVEFASDPNGTGLSSFSLTLTPDSPADAEILSSSCPSGYSCTGSTDPTSGSSTISVSGASIGAPSQLGFFEVRITAPIGQLVPMTLTVTSATDTTGTSLPLPAPVTFNLERGAVLDTVSGSPSTARTIGQTDVTAALGYLSGTLSAGAAAGQVNPINMASMVPPGSTLPNAPGPANVEALLQYLNGQRDAYLAESPPETVSVTASPSANLYGVNLDLSSAVPGLILQNVAVLDPNGNPVPLTSLTASNGGLTYALDLPSTSNGLAANSTYTVDIGTGTNGTTSVPGITFSNATFTTPASPPTSLTATVSDISTTGFALSVGVNVSLVASDLTLRNAAGTAVPITNLQTTDTGANYLVQASLAAGATYTLAISLSGYDFGSALSVAVPSGDVRLTVTINPQTSDLFVTTSPLLPNLPVSDVHITDASGNPVGGVAVSPIYGGSSVTWEVYGNVVDSQSYTLNLSIPGYQVSPAIPFVMPMGNYVAVQATPVSTSSFQVVLSQPETLTASDLTLTGPGGTPVTISSLTTSDGGLTWVAGAALVRGDAYTLAISAPATHANYYASAFTLPGPDSVQVTGVFDGGFDVRLASPLALTAASFSVLDSGGASVAVSSASTIDQLNYKVDADVAPGSSYTVSLTPPQSYETFSPSTPLAVTLPQEAGTVSGITTSGFSLALTDAVPSLAASAFTITDTSTNTSFPPTSVSTGDGGQNYTVSAPLAVGTSYTVAVSDGTSTFGAFAFSLPTVTLAPQVSAITTAGFDVSWGSATPTLTASDVTLKDASGTTVPVTVTWAGDVMEVAAASGSLAPDSTYTLTLASAGYNFGGALTVPEPVIDESANVESVTSSGFTLGLSPAMPTLTASDLALGTGATLTLGTSADGGATYPVTITPSLLPGTDTTLTITKAGYLFSATPSVSLAATSVTGSVYGVGATGLTVALSPAVPGLDATGITLTDTTTGLVVPVQSFTTTDGGSTYTLSLAAGSSFVGSDAYSLGLTSSEYALTAPMTFTGLVPETVTVTNVSPSGFVVNVSPSVTLSAADLTLTENGTSVPIVSFNPATGAATAALSGGMTYTLAVSVAGYDFTNPAPFVLQVTMTSPTSVSATSLTLNFSAPVPGLTPSDIVVTQVTPAGSTVPVSTLTASDRNYRYIATFAAGTPLVAGNTYTVSVNLSGYTFGAAVDLTVPDISVTAAVYGVTTSGFDLSLTPADPNLAQGDITVSDGGNPVSVTLGSSTDGGSTFPVSGTLTSGTTYSVFLSQWGYSFNGGANTTSAPVPPQTVTATVSSPSATGFTLSLSPSVSGLGASNFQIAGPAGSVSVTGATTSDGGASYVLQATLPPDSYQLYLNSTQVDLAAPVTFTVSAVSVTAAVYDVSQVGLEVGTSPTLPGGQLLSYTLDDTTANITTSGTLQMTGSSSPIPLLIDLTPGDTYTLGLSLGGYVFSGPASFTVPATLSDATAADEATLLGTAYSEDEVTFILDSNGYTAAEIAAGVTSAFSLTIFQAMGLLQDIGENGASLPGALLAAFPAETDSEMAALLLGAGYDASSVAAGLKSAYTDTDAQAGAALSQAGASATDIMEALVNAYGDTPSQAVSVLEAEGASVAGVIQALEIYGYGTDTAASAMEGAGYAATVLVPALESAFSLTATGNAEELAAILYQAGYAASDAAAGLKAGGITGADAAITVMVVAGYSASATAQAVASASTYGATAAQIAYDLVPLAPSASQDLALLVGAGFTGDATYVSALAGAGFGATPVAAAVDAQDPGGEAALGTELTSAGYTLSKALAAIDALSGGNDSAAVVAAWPSLFGSGGTLVSPSTAAANLLASGHAASVTASLLETVYPSLTTSGTSLTTALLGGGYTAVVVAPVVKAWYVSAGAGGAADLLAGEALMAGGAADVTAASAMRTVYGDTTTTVVTALESSGVLAPPAIVADLAQAGFGLADVTQSALTLANNNVDIASPVMNLAGFTSTQTLAAFTAAGDTLDVPHTIAMLASSIPGSGGSYTSTQIAQALEAVDGTSAQTVATDLLGPNLPFGVGDVGTAIKTAYGAPPQILLTALTANGIPPYTVLTGAQCRLSLVCTLEATYGLTAPEALGVLEGAGSLANGTIYNVISAVFTTYGITTTAAKETALAEAGYPLADIASYLSQADGLGIDTVISALETGGYSAAEVASFLKSGYGETDGGAAATLVAAGYSLADTVVGLESAYNDSSTLFVTLVEYSIATAAQASTALASTSGINAALSVAEGEKSVYNYSAAQVAASLSTTFGETPLQIAGILDQAGYSPGDSVTGLQEALDIPASEAVSILTSIFGVTSPTAQVAALWQNGGAYGTYQPADIAAGLGTSDPATIASDMLGGGVNVTSVQSALTQVFAPGGTMGSSGPLSLAESLNRLGAASFTEGAASILLTSYGYTGAQQVAILFSDGYALSDVATAAMSSIPANATNYYGALYQIFYEASTCTGNTASLPTCTSGTSTFTPTDAADAYPSASPNEAGAVARYMAEAGYSLQQIATALEDPSGLYKLPIIPTVYDSGPPVVYNYDLTSALYEAGFTTGQISTLLSQAPYSASWSTIAQSYLDTNDAVYGADVANSIVGLGASQFDTAQAMEQAGYTGVQVGEVLIGWGYSEPKVYYTLFTCGFGWELAGIMFQLYLGSPQQVEQAVVGAVGS